MRRRPQWLVAVPVAPEEVGAPGGGTHRTLVRAAHRRDRHGTAIALPARLLAPDTAAPVPQKARRGARGDTTMRAASPPDEGAGELRMTDLSYCEESSHWEESSHLDPSWYRAAAVRGGAVHQRGGHSPTFQVAEATCVGCQS